MKKLILFYSLLFICSASAQSHKSNFQKTVDSINALIKINKLAYYISNKQYNEYITKINATEQGMISFTDSIPKQQVPATASDTTKNRELISDCCPRKNSRKLDLFSVKEWEIHFPYLYLKDENKETFVKFLGFKKTDLEKLLEQFKKLKSLCTQE